MKAQMTERKKPKWLPGPLLTWGERIGIVQCPLLTWGERIGIVQCQRDGEENQGFVLCFSFPCFFCPGLSMGGKTK